MLHTVVRKTLETGLPEEGVLVGAVTDTRSGNIVRRGCIVLILYYVNVVRLLCGSDTMVDKYNITSGYLPDNLAPVYQTHLHIRVFLSHQQVVYPNLQHDTQRSSHQELVH